jgi:hypothetical protein
MTEASTAASRNALVEAGMHRMMQFDLVETRVYDSLANLGSNKKNTYQTKTIWLLNQNYVVFNGNNDRNGWVSRNRRPSGRLPPPAPSPSSVAASAARPEPLRYLQMQRRTGTSPVLLVSRRRLQP